MVWLGNRLQRDASGKVLAMSCLHTKLKNTEVKIQNNSKAWDGCSGWAAGDGQDAGGEVLAMLGMW